MAAENYHLKWDSHLSYLNSSVATLYKNEKFADVVLFSSTSSSNCSNGNSSDGGIPTVGISAHKFILSSCSQFFATMFETAPISSPNGVLYVILPPELSHRAIQILVQYMYSGEATVANDILNEVLRGGEILKIRGLCRTSPTSMGTHNPPPPSGVSGGGVAPPHYNHPANVVGGGGGVANRHTSLPTISHSHSNTHNHAHAHIPSAHAHTSEMYAINKCHTNNGNCASRYSSEPHLQQSLPPQPANKPPHAQQLQHPLHNQFRGLGASVLPKDSPVIVKSPKLSQLGLLSTVAAASSHKQHQLAATGVGGISVNKEVAIDPDEKCCYQLNHHLPVATSVVCNEVGCSGGCPMAIEDEQQQQQQLRRRQRSQNDEQQLEREYTDRTRPPPPPREREQEQDDMEMDMTSSYDRHLRRRESGGSSTGERVRDYYLTESYEHHSQSTKTNSNHPYSDSLNGRLINNTSPISHLQQQKFISIKQEPTDWTTNTTTSTSTSAHDGLNCLGDKSSPLHSPNQKQPLDYKLLPSGGGGGTATIKLELGAQTHSPQIEQEQQESGGDFETHLACETCQQSFEEPKSWVRHLESHANTSSKTIAGAAATTTTTPSTDATITNTSDGDSSSCAKVYVPKKRRRISQQENNVGHVTLCCDLCSISFETPAEWVRHMNNEHTEIELAMFNSKKDNEQKSSSSNNSHQNQQHFIHHRSTYDQQQPVNETDETQPTATNAAAAAATPFSERSDAASGGKKFSSSGGVLTHKRNLNTQNGISVSVSSTNVTSSSQSHSTHVATDVSVISNSRAGSSLANEQLSESSSQA